MFAEEETYGEVSSEERLHAAGQATPTRGVDFWTFSAFGVTGSRHFHTSRFDRRFRGRGNPGSELNPFRETLDWRWNASVLAMNVAMSDRIALGSALGTSFQGDVTVRIVGPYYTTVSGQLFPPGRQVEAILQRRLLYTEGYGLSMGIVGQRAAQINATVPFVGGRAAFQAPLSYSPQGESALLRGFLSAGMETTFRTPALKVGLGFFVRND